MPLCGNEDRIEDTREPPERPEPSEDEYCPKYDCFCESARHYYDDGDVCQDHDTEVCYEGREVKCPLHKRKCIWAAKAWADVGCKYENTIRCPHEREKGMWKDLNKEGE